MTGVYRVPVAEAARLAEGRVSERTLYAWAQAGEISSRKIGKHRTVYVDWFEVCRRLEQYTYGKRLHRLPHLTSMR